MLGLFFRSGCSCVCFTACMHACMQSLHELLFVFFCLFVYFFSFKVGDLDLKERRFLRVERIDAEEACMHLDAERRGAAAAAASPPDTRSPGDGDTHTTQKSPPAAAAAATATATAAAAAAGRGNRKANRRRPPRVIRERAPDAFSKLADQWLRLRGIHPVTFERLCALCPF